MFRTLRKNNDISCNKPLTKSLCSSCVLGKQVRLPFNDSISYTLLPFDIVHSDLWTSPVVSSSGHKYYVLFLDDYTNFLWTFPIANKSHVFSIFSTFYAQVHTQFARRIKCFQCDNGKEYDNSSFHKSCDHNGMVFRFSCPHTSSQNGKAERKIRTINNIMRTLMVHSSLPPTLWHHALAMATYLHNILPTKILNHKSPTHVLYHKAPAFFHIHVFGSLCFPLFPSTTINKLQARSTPCVFLGYPSNHRGYKCLNLSSHTIFVSRHVLFDEHIFPFASNKGTSPQPYQFLESGLPHTLFPNLGFPSKQIPRSPPLTPSPVVSPVARHPSNPGAQPTHSPTRSHISPPQHVSIPSPESMLPSPVLSVPMTQSSHHMVTRAIEVFLNLVTP